LVTYHVLDEGLRAMGYNARNDEIRDNVTRMRQWEAQRYRVRYVDAAYRRTGSAPQIAERQ
jgi:hypothetical protein